mgnify:CR=1 FL=1
MIHVYHQENDDMWYAVAVEDEKVFATTFSLSEKRALQSLLESLPYNVPFQIEEKANSFSTKLLDSLKAIFDGKNVSLSFETVMDYLPVYTKRVLNCTSQIPVGYVTSYGAIAKVVGGSPRAVGRAEASNPFPLLIPCHRVVRGDFSLGGYGGGYGLGVKIKHEILLREDRGYEKPTAIKVNGKTFSLFPVEYIRKSEK